MVAEEIRKLADDSAKAAGEISNNVANITAQTQNSVDSASQAQAMVELQTKAVDEVIAVFREMQARMGQLIEGLKDIAASTEKADGERSAAVAAVKNISDIIEETAGSAETVNDVANKLLAHVEKLSDTASPMAEMLGMQKEEANQGFAKYIAKNYLDWVSPDNRDRHLMSPDIFKRKIFPLLDEGKKVFLIVIDNFRYDQWRMLAEDIGDLFDIDEQLYMSILPTATQYARNAIFSGLMPNKIAEMFPDLWVDEDEEEGKNLNEAPLIQTQIERFRKHYTFSYHKVNDSQGADRFMEHYNECRNYDLNVLVINFIDMLSHARTESKMVRELANNESAYRSITQSWLRHSVLSELFRRLSQDDCKVVITTDHGSIRASKPIKIVGDRNTNTNLRYKLGKNLAYQSKEVFTIKEPQRAQLPAPNLSTSYVFATGDSFFAYPNNYNYYVQYYKDTFQHGGISMEEMLIPLITLTPRKR